MQSLMQFDKECFLCRLLLDAENRRELEEHHVFFGTANRQLSEKHGMKVWLCRYHHTGSNVAVHNCRENDLRLKKIGQRIFENDHSRNEFIEIFGRSYL